MTSWKFQPSILPPADSYLRTERWALSKASLPNPLHVPEFTAAEHVAAFLTPKRK